MTNEPPEHIKDRAYMVIMSYHQYSWPDHACFELSEYWDLFLYRSGPMACDCKACIRPSANNLSLEDASYPLRMW